MPIDPSKALGAAIGEATYAWDADRVILYHLGIGAGVPPTDSTELGYTYEKHLKVLPSFGVIPVSGALAGLGRTPGLEFDFAVLLHGEQELEVYRPIPTRASVSSAGRVAEIWDKGKAALVVAEVETRDESGERLFTNRFGLFLRGEGGFGGEPGPKTRPQPPAREPDGVVESPTLPQQALLYRLSGDKNPLHVDPDFARVAGFDAPILHGLCSYGIACKAIVDRVLDGDTALVARYRARFVGVAYPGDTYLTSYWREGDEILFAVRSKERDAPILANAAIGLRG